MGVLSNKVLFHLYLVIPLVAILKNHLREVKGCEISCDCLGDIPRSSVDGHFVRWRPLCQLMTLMFGSVVSEGVGGGVVCHVFVLRL